MSELLEALPDDIERAACELLELACAHELSIATAESCTGGLLASLLTDVEGASHAFERGFVTYSDDAKRELLGVPTETLDNHGAVSRETAVAMAEGGLERSRADLVLSITGFAGPAAPGDESGLVHFACAARGQKTAERAEHFGDIGRGPVRLAALRVALEMLQAAVEKSRKP